MHPDHCPVTSFNSALDDFQRNAREVEEKLKEEVNNFLWERIPGISTLDDMEELATQIYQLIIDHFDAMERRLKGKTPEKLQCANCLEDFPAAIRGIWGGKDVCPKCFRALLDRGKPKAEEGFYKMIMCPRCKTEDRYYHSYRQHNKINCKRCNEEFVTTLVVEVGQNSDEPFPPFPED